MTRQDRTLVKYGPVVAELVSRTDPSKTYNVRSKDGHLSCNCKGWIFSKNLKPNGDRRCKHTIAYESANGSPTPIVKPVVKQKEYSLLDKLISCLPSYVVTATLRLEFEKILKESSVSIIEPTITVIPMSGVRRIVFDD